MIIFFFNKSRKEALREQGPWLIGLDDSQRMEELSKRLLVALVFLCGFCFSGAFVFLTWALVGISYPFPSPPALSPYNPTSSPAVRVVFPSVKTSHPIAHWKVLWLFPNAHKIISRLLSLDYQTLLNFASVYFSSSSLAIFQDNHQVMPNYPQFPKYEFPAYLHTFGHGVPSAQTILNFLYVSGKFQIVFCNTSPGHFHSRHIWVPLLQGFHNLLNSFTTLNVYVITLLG